MNNFGTLDLIVVIVYLLAIAGLGLYQAVKIKTSGDYFAGGRKFNKWLMMMHALGTGTHADDPVVVTGAAYAYGLSGIWYTFVYLFVTPFYWIIAPFFRRSRFITTADFFRVRYGRKMALLYSVMGVITFALYIGMMLKATGTLASAITGGAVPEWAAITTMTVVFVSYGLAGGLMATVVTESVQGLLILVMSLLLIPFGLQKVGGFSELHSILTPDKFSLHAPQELTLPWIIVGSIMMLIGIVSQPHIMEVCSTGKSEFEGRIGFTYGNFMKRFCAMGWAFTGLIILALVTMPNGIASLGTHRELAFGTAIRELLPVGFTGLMFAAILAAQMSTLSAFMVASSALLARNIFKEHIKPATDDKELLKLARWVGLVVVAVGVLFGFCVSGVAEALIINWGISAFTGVLMWMGVMWKRTNATGAWISFAVMAVLWSLFGPMGKAFNSGLYWVGIFAEKGSLDSLVYCFLPAGLFALVVGSLASEKGRSKVSAFIWVVVAAVLWVIMVPIHTFGIPALAMAATTCLIAAIAALLIGTLFPCATDQRKLGQFYQLLKTPVGREGELTEAGVDMVYAGHSEGHPWELNHPKLVNIGGFIIALIFSLVILLILSVLARTGA